MNKFIGLIALLLFSNLYQAQTDVYGVTSAGGAYNAGTIFKTDITGGNYTKVKDLKAYPQNNSLELCKAADGNFYAFGTLNKKLNIYKYDTITNETIIVNSLKDIGDTILIQDDLYYRKFLIAGLAAATNGKLYGLVLKYSGASTNCSLQVIEFNPATNSAILKQSLPGFSAYFKNQWQFYLASNNNLYIAIDNKIYEYNYSANTFLIKATTPANLRGEFTEYNGNLYNIIEGAPVNQDATVGGVIKYNLAAATYSIINLNCPLTTVSGSNYLQCDFTGMELGADNNMYFIGKDFWANSNNIFKFDPVSENFTTSLTGLAPTAFYKKLVKGNGNNLYCIGTNTTNCSGAYCSEYSVYEYNVVTNVIAEKAQLNGLIDPDLGAYFDTRFSVHNSSNLLISAGNSILEYNIATNTISKKSQMARTFGSFPNGKPLIKNNSLYCHLSDTKINYTHCGCLYNEQSFGPILNYNISSNVISPSTSTLSVVGGNLIDVSPTDLFIGNATSYNAGYAYNYNIISNTVTASHYTENESSGYFSKATDGLIYGTGIEETTGNDYNCVYAIDHANNIEFVVNMFQNSLQGSDMRGIIQANNGKMYGVTHLGGVFGKGVLYSMDITGYNVTKLIDFNGTLRGAFPDGQPLQATNGKIYGTTRHGGTANKGALFSYDIITNQFTKVVDFDGVSKGEQPNGYLQLLPNNLILGMTHKGGANHKGVMFTYNYVTGVFTKKMDFDGTNNGAYPEKCGFTYDCSSEPAPSAGPDKTICNNGQLALGDATNSSLYNYIWTPTVGINMPSSPNPTLTISTNTATYIMNASCDQTNVIDTVTIISIAPQTPSICEVTVDSLSQFNHILWNKTDYTNVDSFIVYREIITGYYVRIGAQPYGALSDYTDTARHIGPANGNPNIGTYRYKLQIKDSCGNVSALSLYHNSIYFVNNNGTFNWNNYDVQGMVTPVSQFNLMRDNNNTGNWQLVGSVAGTQNVLNDAAYALYSATANWRVEALGFNCSPTLKTTQQISKSKSNVKNNFVLIPTSTLEQLVPSNIIVSPNPAYNELLITFKDPVKSKTKVTVTNVVGEIVSQTEVFEGEKLLIQINDLIKGIYFLKIDNGKNLTVKKFIKE